MDDTSKRCASPPRNRGYLITYLQSRAHVQHTEIVIPVSKSIDMHLYHQGHVLEPIPSSHQLFMIAKMPISFWKGNSLCAHNTFTGKVCQSIQISHCTWLLIYDDTWMKFTDQAWEKKYGGLLKTMLFKSLFILPNDTFNNPVKNGHFIQLKVTHLLMINLEYI